MSDLAINNIIVLKEFKEYIMTKMTLLLKKLLLVSNKIEKKEILEVLNEISEGRNSEKIKKLDKSIQNAIESIVFFNEQADLVQEKLTKLMD